MPGLISRVAGRVAGIFRGSGGLRNVPPPLPKGPPPLPWEPGGRDIAKTTPPPLPGRRGPPLLPWEQVSHYPGWEESKGPAELREREAAEGWIGVGSSNVEAIRWVEGDEWPLQVMFLARGKRPRSIYGYNVPFAVYDNMFAASSMGRYVWYVLRKHGYEYKRLD